MGEALKKMISKEIVDRDLALDDLRGQQVKLIKEKAGLAEEVEGLRKVKDNLDVAKAEVARLRAESAMADATVESLKSDLTAAEAAKGVAQEKANRAVETAEGLRKEIDRGKTQSAVLAED